MKSQQPVIAFCGPQGSGKTTLAEHVINKYGAKKVNIKQGFLPLVQAVKDGLQGIQFSEEANKQLMLAISTTIETYVDPNIWSQLFLRRALVEEALIVVDDIRTQANVEALSVLSSVRPVYIFILEASEKVRKGRTIWRPNGGYTEQEPPFSEYPQLNVIRLNTEQDADLTLTDFSALLDDLLLK